MLGWMSATEEEAEGPYRGATAVQIPCWGKGLSEDTLYLGKKYIPNLSRRSRRQPGRLSPGAGWEQVPGLSQQRGGSPSVALQPLLAHPATPASRSIPSVPG